MQNKWGHIASDASIQNAIISLKANGIEAQVVENGEEARKKVLELIPEGAEVMTMTSVTLESIGITQEINKEGSKYQSVKNKLNSLDKETQGKEMRYLGTAPEYAVGGVHAVTEDGKVLVASNSGSQLGAYAYGAQRVLWVIGAQKIVKNLDEAMKRLYEYTLPLESERVKKAYNR